MSEREIERWVTIRGHRVPIYKGETEEDVHKRFSDFVDGKKKVTFKKKEDTFGKSGTYTLHRVGKVDFGKKNYRISFAQDPEYAKSYESSHEGMQVEEYEVEIKNPLVVNLKADKSSAGYLNDEQAGTYEAYNKLFGTHYDYKKDPGVYDHGPFYDYAKYGSVKATKMLRQRDQEIMDEAVRQGYDAVIYKFDRPETGRNGVARKTPISRNEVLIPSEYKTRIKRKEKK